jgi:acetyl-CoA synthetase
MLENRKLTKKGELYFPNEEFSKSANQNDPAVYERAEEDPVKFWEELAEGIRWRKKWEEGFSHSPPYFKWFVGGKLNITESCLDENLKEKAEKTALIWEPEPVEEKAQNLTYRELFEKVNQFANALKKLGVKKGDKVGIYLPMIPQAIVAMLACCRIGAVHAVVFSAFSPNALKVRLQDTESKILITADGYYRRGKLINLKEKADEGIEGTKVEKVIVVKRAGNEVNFQEGRDFWWHEVIEGESKECEAEIMDSEDLLFILYTSGSTGKPKGCCHVCGGYAVQAKWTGKWIFDWKDTDVFWSTADLGWITGHTYSCYGPLLNGITFLIFEGAPDWPEPDRWCQIIEKHKVTIFYTAPTAVRMFEKYGTEWVKKHKLETLRLLGSVGEPIDEAAWEWYFKEVGKERCPIVDTWWQTETGGILMTSLPGIGPFKPAFTGRPFPGVRIEIFDDEGKAVSENKEGSLVILPPFSPSLLRGVYNNPQKYLDTYWSRYGEKVYFTSDAAYRDENGLIRIVGRLDDVIKVAGHRITTGEIEEAVNLHPDITECAVVGKKDEIKGEVPVVFAVFKERKKPEEELKQEVIKQVRKEIGPIAAPKEVYLVDNLPKTRSGKIMRRILKKLFTGEELGDLSTLANPQSVETIKKLIKASF